MQDVVRVLSRLLAAVSCAALLLVALPARAHADGFDKATLFTFDAPVALPGVTLPAGTYMFKLADPNNDRSATAVYDQTGQVCYGIFMTISDEESRASDQPSIQFAEGHPGAPEAVAAWFYPGQRAGWQFVYANDGANS